MLIEFVCRILTVKSYQNTILIVHPIGPNNSHLQYMLNKRSTKLTKICICHVIRHPKHTHEGFPSNGEILIGRVRGNNAVITIVAAAAGEEMHDATCLFDSRVPGRESEGLSRCVVKS